MGDEQPLVPVYLRNHLLANLVVCRRRSIARLNAPSSNHVRGSTATWASLVKRRGAMHSPYGMELVEDCLSCPLCSEGFFCRLPKADMEAFQRIKFTLAHPAGATLFAEGESCRGIYILCRGRVKLSSTSSSGQTLIFKVAKAGEVLGLNATVSGTPARSHRRDWPAVPVEPCQAGRL